MRPATVDRDVRVVLPQVEQIAQVRPVPVEDVEAYIPMQLQNCRKVSCVGLVHTVTNPCHMARMYLDRKVQIACEAHVLVKEVVVQRLPLGPAQDVPRVPQHSVELLLCQ